MAAELMRRNKVKAYPPLHRHLTRHPHARVIDVGCGAGWFVNSCGHYYEGTVTGLDVNPVALRQARSVARLMTGSERVEFVERDIFAFDPGRRFDLVNSLGVLHHTPDCHAAIRKVVEWLEPGGYLHLGLYHLPGRTPFLAHFRRMREGGASDAELRGEFRQLNPDITDETHLESWFRDQVLHPHETQHTYEEISRVLEAAGCVVESTSLNDFGALPSPARIAALEQACERASLAALHRKRRYYPGFFVIWARRR